MSFLLDSHTLLWAILDKKKLSSKVIAILEDTNHEIFVSAVTRTGLADAPAIDFEMVFSSGLSRSF